ncbi:MAG: hypothetical protein KGL39_22160 [Patescibacteria group bacterium]|nr:hypothetical protein [Patescibacteria group bacterium]
MIGIIPGGANIYLYQPGDGKSRWCGFVSNFDTANAVIVQQLQQMYANGMRYLRLPLEHCHDAFDDGFNLQSNGGTLSGQQLNNFINLLATIKEIGFWGLEVTFLASWWNSPMAWVNPGAWNDPNFGQCTSQPDPVNNPSALLTMNFYQENWNFIVNIKRLLAASGLFYRLDLSNEANNGDVAYAKRLWVDYMCAFNDLDHTVGFSIAPSHAGIAALVDIYSGTYPKVFDIHVYNAVNNDYPPASGEGHAGATLRGALTDAAKNGIPVKQYIVGECSANDAPSAADFENYNPVFLMQWPLTAAGQASGNMWADTTAVDWTNYFKAA